MRLSALRVFILAGAVALGLPLGASASTIAIGIGAFGPGSTLTTFDSQVFQAEVNGLTVDGILFGYSLGNGHLNLGGGLGITNNVAPLNILSVGNNTGVLSLSLPSYAGSFGFGFAILAQGSIANAVTISLYDGATLVGSGVYAGSPDPGFTGGFAGISSDVQFNNVRVVFNSVDAPAFALDNIRTSAVPEPGTLLLLGTGVGLFAARRLKRRA
jgi:hypothetical protein